MDWYKLNGKKARRNYKIDDEIKRSKKIFIFTTNRADYGLLKRFIFFVKNQR